MAKLRIKSCVEFEIALRAVPFASARLAAFESHLHDTQIEQADLLPYALWSALLSFVHDAIAQPDWRAFHELTKLYDAVERVGRRSEMYEASYVAFLEDVPSRSYKVGSLAGADSLEWPGTYSITKYGWPVSVAPASWTAATLE
jgi:hypothetical protein